jgi:hypothetical protein
VTTLEAAFREIHRTLKPRTPLPVLKAEFFPSVGANHSATLEDGVLRVRVSDLFLDAPRDILEAIAVILLSKLYRKKIDTRHRVIYRRYTLSPEMLDRSKRIRSERGRPGRTTSPKGQYYDLDQLFQSISTRYFAGSIRKPTLSWTQRRPRTVLGRYDFDGDIIFVSRFLDSEKVPLHVVEYILFHEMLHVKHGTELRKLREIKHPPAFRKEERQFAQYRAAQEWLSKH